MRKNESATYLDLTYRLGRRELLTSLGIIGFGGSALLGLETRSAYAKSIRLSTISSNMLEQANWRYCIKCEAMFFNGFDSKGVCPAGGAHDAYGYTFVLPHDLPTSLDFDFNPIYFDNGVAAGGNAHLTIREDGSYTFTGHFHDSGAAEYNIALVWAVKDSQNMVGLPQS